MSYLIQDRYQDNHSWLHEFDPRVKLVVAVALVVGIVITPWRVWVAYPLLWALVGGLAALGRLGVLRVARGAGIVLPFALAAVTLLFTTPGQPVITVAGVSLTDAGLLRFGSVVCKSWLAAQIMLILAMTTHFTDIVWALGWLRVPRTLVLIISFMVRYLFTLQDEAARLVQARTARSGMLPGHKPGRSIIWRAQVAGSMIGSLFLRSYERSERVYDAMLARGYRGQMHTLAPPPLTWGSIWPGVIPVAVLVLIQIAALELM